MDQRTDTAYLDDAGATSRTLIRFARSPAEVEVAQKLRYSVFYEEMSALASAEARLTRRDADRYDAHCDHLIIVKTDVSGRFAVDDGEMVGTYRLLPQARAELCGGFYTQGEFDIAPLLARNARLNFLELGRSCVLKSYRTRAIINLLWQGIWDYVRAHQFGVMFGCASFAGAEPSRHRLILDHLARHHAPPQEWHARALPDRYIPMISDADERLDARAALKAIPPLIKGYLQLGCYIGDGAVIDRQFNTTDVLIILPVSQINPRYFERFGQPAKAYPQNSNAASNSRA
jgi:L-ornithine Nalpha-acyltransferase